VKGKRYVSIDEPRGIVRKTDVFLLLIDVSDLEPDVALRERAGRLLEDALEALETRVVLALLLVDDAEPKQDFICLVKVRREHGWPQARVSTHVAAAAPRAGDAPLSMRSTEENASSAWSSEP
jgi:hypothetical protein